MLDTVSRITILFEGQFWAFVYEREAGSKYEVCKIIFGAEPKDNEIYDFVLKNFNCLKFSPSIESKTVYKEHINPKRMQRLIQKQVETQGIGTKAQEALKLQQSQIKLKKKTYSREKREQEKLLKFEIKLEKRKEKHRGH